MFKDMQAALVPLQYEIDILSPSYGIATHWVRCMATAEEIRIMARADVLSQQEMRVKALKRQEEGLNGGS